MEAESHIYVMRCENLPYYKIGQALNLEERITQIRVGCPFRVEIAFWAQVENPNKIEKKLHDKYQYQKMQGEWYLLPRKDYYEIVDFLKENSIFDKDKQEELQLVAR